jgi:phosphoenolpyruvate carboxykinase (GTP)
MRRLIAELPRIFHVNWFRKDADGRWMWPGFGQNMRVLEWILRRCGGTIPGHESPIGWIPHWDNFNARSLTNFSRADFDKVMAIDPAEWFAEIISQDELFLKLCRSLPKELVCQRELLAARLS